MNLDEFISETLKGIVKGIKDSQDFAKENGARINPHVGKWDQNKMLTVFYMDEEFPRAVSTINFDIAVTTANEQGTEGKAGINVLSFGIGGKLSDTDKKETISRIKFEVNVVLPNVHP
ncbi:MAG TPA: hypothetical protein VK705_12010 [Ferruginibacter sp.]|jgi:hypothetical protein|nr:hypothetical protein [Ferruginibacter sp.]